MKPTEEIQRGRECAQLLDNPLLKEAFTAIRDNAMRRIKTSGLGEQREREELWFLLRALDLVETHLTQVVTTGKLATTVELGQQGSTDGDSSRPSSGRGLRDSP